MALSHNTSEKNSFMGLKDEIKSLVKKGFVNSVKTVISEKDRNNLASLSEDYSESIATTITQKVDNPLRDKKLQILYNHEKHLLDILKEYKEEIKFAASLQAEIRKEESTFFASTLKEVCNSLKETQIDPKYQTQWIFDLVSSYTSSLKLSSKLAEDHVITLLGEIQKEASLEINKE